VAGEKGMLLQAVWLSEEVLRVLSARWLQIATAAQLRLCWLLSRRRMLGSMQVYYLQEPARDARARR
jgi:hypothetical protein